MRELLVVERDRPGDFRTLDSTGRQSRSSAAARISSVALKPVRGGVVEDRLQQHEFRAVGADRTPDAQVEHLCHDRLSACRRALPSITSAAILPAWIGAPIPASPPRVAPSTNSFLSKTAQALVVEPGCPIGARRDRFCDKAARSSIRTPATTLKNCCARRGGGRLEKAVVQRRKHISKALRRDR